uniref:Uncharacterized protein n=1 Tax=Avena sativa TaxID=4498 RepID=A0ACD5Y4I8_AVESA
MGLGLGAPFFLLLILLLAAGSGAVPQHKRIVRDYDTLDVETIEVLDILPIDKDQIMSSKIPVPAKRGHPVCSTCENVLNKAVSYLSEKETQDDIMEILHGACSQTFSLEQKCVEMVDSYTNLLFTKVSEIKPDEFCKQYGLCRDVAFLSVAKSESTCTFCHQLVDEVLSKMKDPDAQFEIIQLLIKECNKVQGHVQQCKRMVLEYAPLILVNGEKFLEKNDLCTLMQACDTSKKTMVRSFLDGGLRSDV